MIKVSSIEDFQRFVDLAKEKGTDYVILGAEGDNAPMGSLLDRPTIKPPTRFNYAFYLSCAIFNVFISGYAQPDDKQTITAYSSQFGYMPFSKIKLEENGTININ